MKRHLWLYTLALLTTSRLSAQTADEQRLTDIRQFFQQIEQDSSLQKVSMTEREFLGEETTLGGGSMKGYFRGDSLCKIDVSVGLAYGTLQEHYYFSGNRLLFVYETEDDFKQPGATPSFEARYYFDKDMLIQKMATGKRAMGPDDPHHYLELFHNGHYYAGLLVRKYRAHKPSPAPAPAVRTT